MSYGIDSSKLDETYVSSYNSGTQQNVSNDNLNSLNIFQKTLPDTENTNNNLANLDVDELVKKYKKNPIGVLNELGINFTDKEKAELEKIITDKKELKSFLNLIKENQALKPGDILGAMRNIKEYAPKGFFERVKNVVKTAINDGLSEAIDLAKSETVYYAGKLGENMNEVRTERDDFSSESVVNVSETVTKEPEIKEDVMHFVVKSNNDGSKLYTEKDVLKATDIITENIEDAHEFTANAVELESIQDNKGNTKYKGSTIIDVDEKMIKNKEVKSTMMVVAKKSDMTDDFLIDTTTNLAKNHFMAEAIEFLASAKDKDGKDRFNASQVSQESQYLFDKTRGFCSQYKRNIVEYARHLKLNSQDALRVTHSTTEHPEIQDRVNMLLNKPNTTGEQIANYANELANRTRNSSANSNFSETRNATQPQNNVQQEPQNNSATRNTQQRENATRTTNNAKSNRYLNANQVTNPLQFKYTKTNTQDNIIEKTYINGVAYERSTVLRELTKKYGVSAEKVLNAIEKDSTFIDLMKQYNGNQTIINSLVEDPYLIQKIKKTTSSLSINELADVIKLCTDSSSTEVMLAALENHNPQEAMMITKKSKIFNLKDDTLEILSKSNTSADNKKNELEDLYFTGNRNKEIIG